jgi:two-component system, OmpR family, response regulator
MVAHSILKSVLVIEGDFCCVTLIADIMKRHGLSTIIASRGAGARQIVKSHNLSLVTMDLCLPDEDGIFVLEDIRSSSSVPIIIVTALLDDEIRGRCWRLGANDYVTKPFIEEELWAKVSNFFRYQFIRIR